MSSHRHEMKPRHAYRLLEAGPVLLLTTRSDSGDHNVMTAGFHMMIQHTPALIGIVVGPWDHSYRTLRDSGECVIAIPSEDLAEKVVDIGNCTGETLDKFARFGLTRLPSRYVEAPSIAECLANLECRVADDSLVERYHVFILEVLSVTVDPAWKDHPTLHHHGDGRFSTTGRKIDLSDRMTKWRYLMED